MDACRVRQLPDQVARTVACRARAMFAIALDFTEPFARLLYTVRIAKW
jgi:hypothetical protein